jgi:hypothetical protein
MITQSIDQSRHRERKRSDPTEQGADHSLERRVASLLAITVDPKTPCWIWPPLGPRAVLRATQCFQSLRLTSLQLVKNLGLPWPGFLLLL